MDQPAAAMANEPGASDGGGNVFPTPPVSPSTSPALTPPAEQVQQGYHRDRLLASIALTLALGFAIALPFALKQGAEFFLPVTAALVVAVALVPLLEWLERRRVPSGLAAFFCLLFFIGIANIAVASIVVPAMNWVSLLPQRIGRIRTTVRPLVEVYGSLNKSLEMVANAITVSKAAHPHTVTIESPNSMLTLFASSAPFAIIQVFFAMLVIYFFLAGWSRMRRATITRRSSFSSALALARVIQEVVDATAAYIGTITAINVTLGCIVAAACYWVGLPTPLMWGGLVALLNYVPYLGPIAAALLLALGGVMSFADPLHAFLPAVIFIGLHLMEANVVTPTIVGRRLTINPLLILVSLSFWGWVWGTVGALLAVPLLVIGKTILEAAGSPDIAGFLFERGTLAMGRRNDHDRPPPVA